MNSYKTSFTSSTSTLWFKSWSKTRFIRSSTTVTKSSSSRCSTTRASAHYCTLKSLRLISKPSTRKSLFLPISLLTLHNYTKLTHVSLGLSYHINPIYSYFKLFLNSSTNYNFWCYYNLLTRFFLMLNYAFYQNTNTLKSYKASFLVVKVTENSQKLITKSSARRHSFFTYLTRTLL